MDRKEKIRRQLLATFQAELEEHLSTLNRGLMALEEGRSQEERQALVAELFRAAHSVKGASRAVGIREIEVVAHRLEDVLGAIQRNGLALSPELFDTLLPAVDALGEAMSAHQEGKNVHKEKQGRVLENLDAVLRGETAKPLNGETREAVRAKLKPAPAAARRTEEDDLPEWEAAPPAPETLPEDAPPRKAQTRTDSGQRKPAPPKTPEPVREAPKAGDSLPEGEAPKVVKAAQDTDKTIRVSTDKLDTLMARMGELVVARMRTGQRLAQIEDLQQRMIRWQKSWRRLRGQYKTLRQSAERSPEFAPLVNFLAENEECLKSMDQGITELATVFATDRDRLGLITDDLQDSVRRVRMLPVSTIFDLYPRMVRDLCRDSGKEVRLSVEGDDTEVDRQVLDTMRDPLTHILRNAIDHGMRTPDEREAKGKPRRGIILLRAAQQGGTIVLEIKDDGEGIDLEKLRAAAVKKGLLSQREAAALGRQETLDLIFYSGLSTQTTVTDLSGRGVGLDVVRENIKRLQGIIQVDSVLGKGTTFTLTLPLTLATSQVLLVRVGGETVAVPTIAVDRILQVTTKRLGSIEGKPAVLVEGRPLPLVSMARVLEMEKEDRAVAADEKISIIVLGVAEKRLAFRVDGLHDTQEVVIKNLGRQLARVRYVAGATILGSGEVIMILNVGDLLKTAGESAGIATIASITAAREQKRRKNRVLVVDDSITTRTLEKNILESAGYQVTVAADGEEAWGLLQGGALDIVVSDVDMPRLNGFGLAERVKGDGRLKEIPFVLVTSLESPKDKLQGLEAGADAYIVKGSFDQSELLETIERLVG
jgi:two-component system chemotaxis sensor kinase CheA